MADNKKSIFPLILFLLFLLLVGIFGYNFLKNLNSDATSSTADNVMSGIESTAETTGDALGQIGETVSDGLEQAEDGLQTLIESDIDLPSYDNAITSVNTSDLLRERSIGNPNAPLKVVEHSSLTCSHCGTFHQNAYKQIKENYIDTGKLYLTFSDFPLNGPAVTAAMVSRCVPEGRYFDFIQFLFERQDDWAYKANYATYLKQNAQLTGLNEESFETCVNNEELKEGLLNKMRQTQEAGNVNATPTFVINGETVISGAHPYEYFAKIFDAELAKINLAQ